MKNFVIIGDLWKRVIEFTSEAKADAYMAKNCHTVAGTSSFTAGAAGVSPAGGASF